MNDTRTIQQLAKEALMLQDASNLPGVLYTWNESIRRLMKITNLSSDKLHAHPINRVYCSKVQHLTGMNGPYAEERSLPAFEEVERLALSPTT